MAPIFDMLIQLIEVLPGRSILQWTALLLVLAAFLVAIHLLNRAGSKRVAVWLCLILLAQGFLVLSQVLDWGPYNLLKFLPILPAAVAILSLLWLGWLWAFPLPPQNRAVNVLWSLLFAALNLLLFLAVAFESTQWQLAPALGAWFVPFWQYLPLALVGFWILITLIRHPRGWFAAFLMAALLTGGWIAQRLSQAGSEPFGTLYLFFQTLAFSLLPVFVVEVSKTGLIPAQEKANWDAREAELTEKQTHLTQELEETRRQAATLSPEAIESIRQEQREETASLYSEINRLKRLLSKGGYTASLHLEEELQKSLEDLAVLQEERVIADNRVLELERDAQRTHANSRKKWEAIRNEAGLMQPSLSRLIDETDQLMHEADPSLPIRHLEGLTSIQAQLRELETRAGMIKTQAAPEPERVSPGEILLKISAAVAGLLEARGVQLDLQTPADLPNIFVQREKLEDALQRALRHAIEVSPQGGVVELNVAQKQSETAELIEFSLTDQGGGYSFDQLANLFEQPVEGDAAWQPAAIRADVLDLDGELRITSVPSASTTVTISLPVGSGTATES